MLMLSKLGIGGACSLALACSAQSSQPPPSAAPARPPPAGASASSPGAASAEPAAELPPAPEPDSCATHVPRDGAADQLLHEVARSCLIDMQPFAPEPLLVNLEAGALKDVPFTVLDPSRCVRAVAAGAKEIKELELTIVDRSDQVLGKDELGGSIALANLDGPICLEGPGQYRAVVRLVDGQGQVAVQVWQAEPAQP